MSRKRGSRSAVGGKPNKRISKPEKTALIKFNGTVSINARAIGYVKPPLSANLKIDDDIEIVKESLNTALNGDEVEVVLLPKKRGLRQGGKIVSVNKRAKLRFAGVVAGDEHGLYVIADDRRVYVDFIFSKTAIIDQEIKVGDKVVVSLKSWDDPKENPVVRLERILGKAGDNDAEMKALTLSGGFDYTFPSDVLREARTIKAQFDISEHAKDRKDMRGVPTFTIDPASAKDFDDAISVGEKNNGLIEIGVHIADVSHFVQQDSALDKEAYERAVSVYMVDRTVPMLPPELSEDLCSLNPDEDKLAFSAILSLDKDALVKKCWFGRTIIRSKKRFTYEDAQSVLDGATQSEFSSHLLTLHKLARKLKSARLEHGAIEFEEDEVGFEWDSSGNVVSVHKKARLDTHKLVEEFMLLANAQVAEYIERLNKKGNEVLSPFIYRIHDLPDPQKIEDLAIFVRALGHTLPKRPKGVTPKDISAMLARFEGEAVEGLVRSAALRAMAKAVYSVNNIGHFGLSMANYTHFTSPIRRYPDVLVHRLLCSYLSGKTIPQKDIDKLQQAAMHCSRREIEAVEIERASIKYHQVRLLAKSIGEEFDAKISGVSEWGIYVMDDNTKAEGMVRLKSLSDDFYEIDTKNYRVIGKRKGKTYSLGQMVRVRLIAADKERKTLDFELA